MTALAIILLLLCLLFLLVLIMRDAARIEKSAERFREAKSQLEKERGDQDGQV